MPNFRDQCIEHVKAAIQLTGEIEPPDLLRDAQRVPEVEQLLHQALVHLRAIPAEARNG